MLRDRPLTDTAADDKQHRHAAHGPRAVHGGAEDDISVLLPMRMLPLLVPCAAALLVIGGRAYVFSQVWIYVCVRACWG